MDRQQILQQIREAAPQDSIQDTGEIPSLHQFQRKMVNQSRELAAIGEAAQVEAIQKNALANAINGTGAKNTKEVTDKDVADWHEAISSKYFKSGRNWKKELKTLVLKTGDLGAVGIPGPTKMQAIWDECYERVEEAIDEPDAIVYPLLRGLLPHRTWGPQALGAVIAELLFISFFTASITRENAG